MEPIDSDFIEVLFKDYLGFIQKVPDASATLMGFETHPSHVTLLHSQTETAFPNRGTFGNFLVFANYKKDGSAPACKKWCQEIHGKVHKEFERRKIVDNVDETTKTAVGEYINSDGGLCLHTLILE